MKVTRKASSIIHNGEGEISFNIVDGVCTFEMEQPGEVTVYSMTVDPCEASEWAASIINLVAGRNK